MFGNKDTDGFYRAEIRDRAGLIPCNMVSEIQTEDEEMMDQLLKQGFLPLNTPVEKLGETTFSLGQDHLSVFFHIFLPLYPLCLSGQLNALLNCLLLTLFCFPLPSPLNYVFLLSCKVNCDRFKDGRSINRRSRKSKRGLCPVRCSSALCLIFTVFFFHFSPSLFICEGRLANFHYICCH